MKNALPGTRAKKYAAPALLLAAALTSGCSGIQATKSISPLDFLLPGLLKNDNPALPLLDDTTAVICRQVPRPRVTWRNNSPSPNVAQAVVC